MNINKRRLYRGNPAAREAARILTKSPRFILLAEQPNPQGEPELKLYACGYPAEALIAKEMMTVAVNLMKRHKDAAEAAMEAARQATAQPTTIQPYAGLVLPPTEAAPPAFGQTDIDDG